jgi:hypothetical protein
LTQVCQFAAEELSAEPYLRSLIKKEIEDKGYITIELTDKGKKDIDELYPTYKLLQIQ